MTTEAKPAAPALPRGVLKPATEALADPTLNRDDDGAVAMAVLLAAVPAIERAALRQAARRILLFEEINRGWRCPACHGKPATTPHAGERRTGYTCGCGHAWEPPKNPDWNLRPDVLLKKLARGEALPELPAKAERTAP